MAYPYKITAASVTLEQGEMCPNPVTTQSDSTSYRPLFLLPLIKPSALDKTFPILPELTQSSQGLCLSLATTILFQLPCATKQQSAFLQLKFTPLTLKFSVFQYPAKAAVVKNNFLVAKSCHL